MLKRKIEKYKQKEIEVNNEYEDIKREITKDIQLKNQDIEDIRKLVDMKNMVL